MSGITYRGVEILWDRIVSDPQGAQVFWVAPKVYKAWKHMQKQFGRRDKRRKHKRYATAPARIDQLNS